MSSGVLAFLLLQEELSERVKRRILRDRSNPLEIPDASFVGQYRLSKEAFIKVLDTIEMHLRPSSIPPVLQLAGTLRFLEDGSYQRSVGNDANISMGRSTISEMLTKILPLLERFVCHQWVSLEMDENEKQESRRRFYSKYRIPGIIGCIDGTHVKISKPHIDEHLFFNRKGYFSMNAMIICDSNMMIRAVDARHDSFVWNLSSARQHLLHQFENGDRISRLLSDGGYGIQPFLITPYRDPQYGSQQYKFNMAHCSARNIVERTIGVLKSRFRCLQGTLHYQPKKVVKIINICCALHNICRRWNIECSQTDDFSTDEMPEDTFTMPPSATMQNAGQRIRDEKANTL